MSIETEDSIQFENNLVGDFEDSLRDTDKGDLHLAVPLSESVDKGIPLPTVDEDIDKERRDAKPDIGADEWMKSPSIHRKEK